MTAPDIAPALPDLAVEDRVRAAVAACPDGVRPATLEQALDLAGELRATTEQLEEADELRFEHGRLHVADTDAGALARATLAKVAADDLAALHARLARAIGRTSYEPGVAEVEQAGHELLAGERDRAIERLTRAAHDAMRSADHALVVRAIDLLDEAGADVDAELRELHARAAHECGDARAPKLWATSVAAWTAAGDAARIARAVVAWFWSAPEDAAAAARLRDVAEDGAGSDAAATGWQAYARAVRAIFDASWGAALEPLEDALGAARDAGDRGLEAAVLGSLATARSYLGQMDLAIELLRRCAPLAAADSDAVAVRRARHNLVETLVEALRTREAIEEAERFTSDVRRMGARHYEPGALALEARVRAIAGDLATARSLATSALAKDRELDEAQRDVYVHMVAAELLAIGGATDRFRGFVGDVAERCRELGFGSYEEALDEVRARAALVDGDTGAMAKVLQAARTSEATGMATVAAAAARLIVEQDEAVLRAALVAHLERIDALGEAERSVPLVAIAMREARAALAQDVAEIARVAEDLDTNERPVDAAILRRAQVALHHEDVEASRVAAQLEAFGWSALAHRPVAGAERGDDDVVAAGVDSLPLFAALPASERASVLALVERRELLPPSELGTAAPPAGLCIIASGEVRLLRAEPGTTDRRLVVAALGPGDVFGHDSLVDDGVDHAGDVVEAATPSVLHVVPRDALATVTASAPGFAAAVLADASDRLREARMLAGESALLPVETRLARTLVRLGERFGRPSLRGELLLDTSLTHADIASMIGSQRARVSSLLGALHKAGVTDTWKRRIVVLDTAELRRRASLDA